MSRDAQGIELAAAPSSALRRPAFLVALAVFAALAVLLAVGLTLNPREIPSPLIGKPVPQFELPPVRGRALELSTAGGRRDGAGAARMIKRF